MLEVRSWNFEVRCKYAETYLPAKKEKESAGARVSPEDAHARRARGLEAPTREGPKTGFSPINRPSMLPRHQRLTASKDIEAVRKLGKSFSTPIFGLRVVRTGGPTTRFAVVAGLQVHKSAVKRNRPKRQVREALRKHAGRIPPGFDVVLSLRSGILGKQFSEIESTLLWALGKIGLIR